MLHQVKVVEDISEIAGVQQAVNNADEVNFVIKTEPNAQELCNRKSDFSSKAYLEDCDLLSDQRAALVI